VNSASFVIDVQHASADHDGDEHGEGDRSGQEVLEIFNVRVELDDFKRSSVGDARGRGLGLVERRDQLLHFVLQRGGHELIAVVDDHAKLGILSGVKAARKLRRNDERAFEASLANVFAGADLVGVRHGAEGADVGLHGVESLIDAHCLGTVILIDDGYAGIADFSTEGVAEDDELHERHDHGGDHECRGAEKLAHLALDDGEHSIHGCIPGRGGIT
jgi:hypothetical protein